MRAVLDKALRNTIRVAGGATLRRPHLTLNHASKRRARMGANDEVVPLAPPRTTFDLASPITISRMAGHNGRRHNTDLRLSTPCPKKKAKNRKR